MKNRFIRALPLIALLAIPNKAQAADTYTFDPSHTSVIWKVAHMGFSAPHGIFSNIEGTLLFDEADVSKSKVDVVVKTDGISTGIKKFDDHLKNADFFDVEKFPEAKFVSTQVKKTGKKTGKVTGDLTLNGVTKPVTLDVTFNKKAPHPMNQKPTVGFSATGVIKRSEFGIKYALPAVGDDVTIQIEAEANGEAAATTKE
jgi:polyisoprenoid-binding protein YceI